MKFALDINGEPSVLLLDIEAPVGTAVGVDVRDSVIPNTVYSSTVGEFDKKRITLETKIPVAPMRGIVDVYNSDYPVGDRRRESGFRILARKRKPMKVDFDYFKNDANTLSFINFAKDFFKRASILSAGAHTGNKEGGSVYKSDDLRHTIRYVDDIIDWVPFIPSKENPKVLVPNPRYGKVVSSSMRINAADNEIQIAKRQAVRYTVPEGMMIAFHEFAHGNKNKNRKNEFEADYNAVMIHYGLGFTRREAATAWIKVYERTPSDLNVVRLNEIIKLLKKLDARKVS